MSTNLPVHEPVIDFVVKAQDLVLENLTKVTNTVSEQLPTLPIAPADEFLARGADYVDGGYALAEDLLGKNRVFVSNLFNVAKALVASMVETEVVAMPAKKAA